MAESQPINMSESSPRGSSQYSQDVDGHLKDSDSSSALTVNSSVGNDEARRGAKKSTTSIDSIDMGRTRSCGKSPGRHNLKETKQASSTGDVETVSGSISFSAASESSLVGWTSQHDPENPKNFRPLTKFFIGLIIGLMNFIVSLAISIFSEVSHEAGYELGYDDDILQLGVSSFILGVAFGPLLFGPASEYFGRKRPLVTGLVGFVGFTVFVPMLRNIEAIVLCRLLAGFCGSAAYVVPPGVFVDMYGPVGRAVGYSIFASGSFVGGSLGPGVGAMLVHQYHLDWTWAMWAVALFAVPLTVSMMFLPETLEAVILQRKSRRIRLQTGDWSLHCRRDEVPIELKDYLLKPWRMLIREPVLIIITIAFTLDYGIQSLTYSAIPTAFVIPHRWLAEPSAWMLTITLVGFLVGCVVVVVDTKWRFQKQMLEDGAIAPEKRLPPIIAGMSILTLGLLLFAWKSSPSASPHEQALAEILIGQGMYMVWVTATLYVQDLYVGHVNSALAACAFVRYAVGAVFPMCATPLYDKLGIQWAVALLGILCAIQVPFQVLFYFKGQCIRQWSKFAIHGGVSPQISDTDE